MFICQNMKRLRKQLHHVAHRCYRYGIQVTPSGLSHVSERLVISGSGFKPNFELTVQGKLVCPSEYFDFISYSHIITDSEGCFDLSSSVSLSGTYTGIDGMGLLWSMARNRGNINRLHMNNSKMQLNYNFNVFQGHVTNFEFPAVCSASIQRQLISDFVTRQDVKFERLRGTLLIPEGKGPFPAIITIHGGSKNGKSIEQDAALLASEGFATLALSFYGIDGLPHNYTTQPIDIEYFERAIDWLSSLDNIKSTDIGVLGHSKGGDIALAMATHLKQIKSICFVNGNIASVLTDTVYHGEITPRLPFDFDRLAISGGLIDTSSLSEDPADHPDSIHQFEKSAASMLFIVGLDDAAWDVSHFIKIAKKRMENVGKTNFEILEYKGLGHCVDIPYAPVCNYAAHPLAPEGLRIFYGGINKSLHAQQHLNVWDSVFRFFKSTLNG